MGFLKNFSVYIERTFHVSVPVQQKALYTMILLFLLWAVRFVVLRVVYRKTTDVKVRYQWRKTSFYTGFFIAMLIGGRIWIRGFESFSTYFGLVSAGIAITLKDLFASIAGWIFLMIRKPLSIGDRIEVGNLKGDVIDIRLFKFTIMEIGNWVDSDQSTGRVIHIPNSYILNQTIANYSRGFQFIWDEIPVLLTFESHWKEAKKILIRIAQEHTAHLSKSAEKRVRAASRKFMIHYSNLTPTVYTSVQDSGVLLTIRYLCDPRSRRGQREIIWEDILNAFAATRDIDFAYPTTRYYVNKTESISPE